MKHYIKDDTYYILDNNDEIILTIELTEMPGNQIVLTTAKEVYAGPINLLTFDES